MRGLILIAVLCAPLAAQVPSLSADLLSGQGLPAPAAIDVACPINLATALSLANAKPLDIALAAARVEVAAAQYQRSKLLWVPDLSVGADYYRHDGGQQNFQGEIVRSNRQTAMAGFGPNVTFALNDAWYAPLAARQDLLARRAFLQAASNDTMTMVAEAYFGVQQARVELAGAQLALNAASDVAAKAEKLAEGLTPPLEANRARVELARRKQAVSLAKERWRTASAELTRLLRLDAGTIVEPVEPPGLPVPLIRDGETLDSLVPIALTNRPELAGQQAIVQATLARLKQEKIRPLVPSLAISSVSTNPSGSLGYGVFGGGRGDQMERFGHRFDVDAQLLWQFSALGLGNKARVNERKAELQLATLELFASQDRIAAEVATEYARLLSATERLNEAAPALKDAMDLVAKSQEGMGATRRAGDLIVLVVRPQEVVAAIQLLAQANLDYAAAVGDYNRSHFRLYRALGHPAVSLTNPEINSK